ncbi:hypothetical protein G6M50_16380 [Agrobacterium rhizogenes]|jgi:hypothetical protein|nr:hypothetical protein [Rhizobium rhizogenes]NTJ79364.1 hypothetical protein [Rhizobium rhizogenes]
MTETNCSKWSLAALLPITGGIALSTMIGLWGATARGASGDDHPSKAQAPLCEDVRDMLANNTDMRMAETLAFGKNARFRAEGSSEKCVSLAALMTFTGSRVLITAIPPDPGESGLDQGSSLSAYFFRESGSALRLVTVKRDFAESNGALGNVGDINAAHFGADDGMMVNGGISQQGYSNDLTDFYVFRNGSIVSLGMIPTGWSNSGAEEDDSKAVTVTSRVETGLPQPDRVRVTYTRSAGGGDEQSSVAIWRSQAGKFVLEAGTVPEEIITGFELAGNVIARNGTPVPATDAAPPPPAAGTGSPGVWSIDDIGMVPPSPDVTEAIKHDSNYPPICKLTGREMLPSLSATSKTWFVTTSNRCDAGGGTGPVWIVSVAPTGKASVVFSAFRHAVKAERGLHGEFHDMFVNGDARNAKSGEIYTFDGLTYRKNGS